MSSLHLSIVSFDLDREAAGREAADDRSLNLLLRRKGVRSEIYRLTLDPSIDEIELLVDVIANGPSRPVLFVCRDFDRHTYQVDAVNRLRRLSPKNYLVRIAPIGPALSHIAGIDATFDMSEETQETMQNVAQWIIDRCAAMNDPLT